MSFYIIIDINMSSAKLQEIKAEVQKILNNHLNEDERFSIEDLDEEWTFLLIDLLLEKDNDKKDEISKRVNTKLLNSQKNLKLIYENILQIKDTLDYQKSERSDLTDLQNLVDADHNLDNQLNNL